MEEENYIFSLYYSNVEDLKKVIIPNSEKNLLIENVIEVPFDLYDDIFNILKETVKDEKIDLKKRLVKGKFNFVQVKKICKLGKIQLLTYNSMNNSVVLFNPISISTIILFSCMCWNPIFQSLLEKELTDDVTKKGISKLKFAQTFSLDESKLGASIVSTSSKAVFFLVSAGGSHNPLLAPVSFSILSSVDVYRYFNGTISKSQLGKNLTVIGAGTAGGIVGTTGGAVAGGILGTILIPIPFIGTAFGTLAGGILGGIGGNLGGSLAMKKYLDKYVEDDAKRMWALFQEELTRLCAEYILSHEEVDNLLLRIKKEEKLAQFLRKMFSQKEKELQKECASFMIEEKVKKMLKYTRMNIIIDKTDLEMLALHPDLFENDENNDFMQQIVPPPPPKKLLKRRLPPKIPLHLLKKKNEKMDTNEKSEESEEKVEVQQLDPSFEKSFNEDVDLTEQFWNEGDEDD